MIYLYRCCSQIWRQKGGAFIEPISYLFLSPSWQVQLPTIFADGWMGTYNSNQPRLVYRTSTKRKPPVLPILRAFAFIEYHIFLPMAIIAYANLEINIPTCLKSKKISTVCHKNVIKLYFSDSFCVWKYCKIKAFQSFPQKCQLESYCSN